VISHNCGIKDKDFHVQEKFYSDEKNAQIVIALLKTYGIKKVVASPGTTNIPITGSIQNDSFFEVCSAADERSAAYIACGLAAESGEPVVLSCTGATASRNYLPGLTEAYYRKLPVIAVTSMTCFSHVGNLFPQAIDRSGFPKDAAVASVFLPTVKDSSDFKTCERLVAHAILETLRGGGGPVHINLETCGAGTFDTRVLPAVRAIHRIRPNSRNWPEIPPHAKIAVFIGSHKRFSDDETRVIELFAKSRDAVILCDHTSSYKGYARILSALPCAQNIHLRSEFTALKPDLIVHVGEVSGDYPTQNFLDNLAPVWRISEDGTIRDKFQRLEYVFEMREREFFQRYIDRSAGVKDQFLQTWDKYANRVRESIPELPFSNAWIAKTLSTMLAPECSLHFAILNSLRCWNFFEVSMSIETASNVGGFGIDGCVSALIGASLAKPERLFLGVIGDLAFFYDMNSLANRHVGNNLRILLVNNGGGVEFKLYNHMGAQFGEQTGEFIAAARHYGNKSPELAKHYALDLGFKYLCARSKEDFVVVADEFVSEQQQDKPILFECFTDLKTESDAVEMLDHLDTTLSAKVVARQRASNLAKKVLPTSVQNAIRSRLRK